MAKHDDLQPSELVALRSSIQSAIIILSLNRQLKFYMVDCFKTKNDFVSILVRIITGVPSSFFSFTIVRVFNLTMHVMSLNCSPLLVMVLAPIFLKERVKATNVVYLILAFAAITIMIMGVSELRAANLNKRGRDLIPIALETVM